MSTAAVSRASKQEKKGSFFKLVESFAFEIGTLKKEMGNKSEPKEADVRTEPLVGLGEEVGGLFLQAAPCSGIISGLAGVRDSGYDSLHRRLSVLDRLAQTHSVWLQLGLNHQEATQILKSQPPGTFLVRKSTSQQRKVISLRMDKDRAVPVKDYLVKESQYTFALEGSGLSFADLFRLVAFCCISRDVLPFTLKLPEPIAAARTSADLDDIAKLGPGFWDSQLWQKRKISGLSISAPDRPPPPIQRSFSTPAPICPRLKTRSPSELECCQSNGALCFINPLFIKVHQLDANKNPETDHEASQNDVTRDVESETKDCSDAKQEDSQISPSSTELQENKNLINTVSQRSPPPPRPPPPCFTNRCSAPLIRHRSMPEKVPWIVIQKDKSEGDQGSKEGSLLSRLSSSLSISPSSSPPKKLMNISSPISIPKRSLPLSIMSLSTSPRRSKMSPASSQEDAQCHLALEDHFIEQALNRAEEALNRAKRLKTGVTCKEGDEVDNGEKATEIEGKEEESEDVKSVRGGQRLSDMSLSTDSSDSLDFSQSSGFFFPPIHDPNPPTLYEINTHLPLSLLPSHLPYSSMEEDEDDDDDDDDEEEQDYGVSLESDQDQDQDLTMVPPGHRIKRRTSAGALVIQKAFKGQLRKMSGVFNSLLTPEKRAVRRVLELSRNKSSYFGCLVQDYLSYMRDQVWQGFDSASELLQTLRQFLTQMKSYLRQSSELEPPIESLIPEDQIDAVLEKAMHKCVLKPLKPVINEALQQLQIRSGAWTELKENLSLAKTRSPPEMGVADVSPPDTVAIEKIRHKFHTMCKLYSPEKKVGTLLRVCKLIYTIMEDNAGRLFGADDFLPMLTYVLAQVDMPQLDNEILYMMELLDPTLLIGEGGYYLTSAYGAMSLIKNFQEEQAARVLSSEAKNTLCQWHRRRTMQRSSPTIDDFQNYLRVALQEPDSGCTAKTLCVRPQATVEDVCALCAAKFSVSEPQSYGLFLLTEGSSQQLAPDTHPQKIKAELHSRDQPAPFHFVYRRLDSTPASVRAHDANANPTTDPRRDRSPTLRLTLPRGNVQSVSI